MPSLEGKSVRIVEVGPRDGLQNIPQYIPTAFKIELIHRLRKAGLNSIELTAAVSPRAVPQLADCTQLLQESSIQRLLSDRRSAKLSILVPNLRGLQTAQSHGVREIAVFVSATESFSRANINCNVEEGLKRARSVILIAKRYGIAVRGYVSCIFEDPWDGPTPPVSVLKCTRALLDCGCDEVSLGDTLGTGYPQQVTDLLSLLKRSGICENRLAAHFHDTYGRAISNAWAAYQSGIRVFDSSIAGLGGCPFAPGASGNVATEALVEMFEGAGIKTNVNLEDLIETGDWILKVLSICDINKPNQESLEMQESIPITRNPPKDAAKKLQREEMYNNLGTKIQHVLPLPVQSV